MTRSPWTYSATPMELHVPRPLNSSSSEASVDSGFETPASAMGGNISPFSQAIVTQVSAGPSLSDMLVSCGRGLN